MALDIEQLYVRYGGMVMRRCRQMLHDEEAAADAMQDVFVQALRYRDRLEQRAPSSLLYTMATNVCLNRLRSKRRHPEDPESELIQRIAEAGDAESKSLAARTLEKLFGKELASTRTIAALHLVDGMTLEEVAREVDMSVSGVRRRLRQLREHLQELEAAA